MLKPCLPPALLGAALSTLACAPAEPTKLPAGLHSPFTGYASATYRDDRMWLCRPDLADDRCRVDLTATEIRPDGSRAVVPHLPAADPAIDCFYVYPTVDMGVFAGNHTDFGDLAPMERATVAQAARFSEVCRLYVPLYRQVSIGTYLLKEGKEPYLEVAASDVEDAFLHYMGQYNQGRKVALIGHSQGAEMVVRLLQRRFDHDAAMRERLVVAMPIGGQVEVAKGQTSGGTFSTLPLCTRADEAGCVVAYRSYREGQEVSAEQNAPKPGNEAACVDPTLGGAGGEPRRFSRTYFPLTERGRKWMHGVDEITTPFLLMRGFYSGRCVEGKEGYRYLSVSAVPAPEDQRTSPIDLGAWVLNTVMGLHVLDFQFPQGDLIDSVARRALGMARPGVKP